MKMYLIFLKLSHFYRYERKKKTISKSWNKAPKGLESGNYDQAVGN